jgi:hypothetical protein
MAAAASPGHTAGRREVTADHRDVKLVNELEGEGMRPADIGKFIGPSRATVYRYPGIDAG